jgi:hypothetical protein
MDDCLNEAQSKTGTTLCPTYVTPIESFEYMGEIIFRYADTRITDGNGNLPIIRIDRNRDRAFGWSVFQSIIKEVGNHALKLSSFSVDHTAVR